MCVLCRGLDNSGKTTIVLKLNGEDTSVISPTLGFNIKTITYSKYVVLFFSKTFYRTCGAHCCDFEFLIVF